MGCTHLASSLHKIIKTALCLSLGLATFTTVTTTQASESANYTCGGNGFSAKVETIPEQGNAEVRWAGRLVIAEARSNGGYINDQEAVQFFPKSLTLWLGSETFSCRNAYRSNVAPQATNGRSLGGKVRSGPGTDYAQIGSLREGAPITIIGLAGESLDGYEWFEIQFGTQLGYQWGGIMCSQDTKLSGIYAQCGAAPTAQSSSNTNEGGWMAFAVGSNGIWGHGAGATRQQAEQFALQYCNNSSCNIADVSQAKCHALATVPGGLWFGAASNQTAANNFALGFCQNAGASQCKLEYAYCQ